jgi:hypothetical protein
VSFNKAAASGKGSDGSSDIFLAQHISEQVRARRNVVWADSPQSVDGALVDEASQLEPVDLTEAAAAPQSRAQNDRTRSKEPSAAKPGPVA